MLSSALLYYGLFLATANAVPLLRRQQTSQRGILQCFDIPNPLEPNTRVTVSCIQNTFSTAARPNYLIDPAGNAASATSAAAIPTQSLGSSSTSSTPNAFQILLECEAADGQRADYCQKVQSAFDNAGQILSDIFDLRTTIVVNATVSPFCPDDQCGRGEAPTYLGSASAARLLPLQDDDGKTRFYPQALAKQFDLATPPVWAPFDIRARFNSRPEVRNSWFRGDADPSGWYQSDFETTVLHELIHGLGFSSAWLYAPETTQYNAAYFLDVTGYSYTDGRIEYAGLYEYAFDRFLYINNSTSLTTIAQQIQDSILPNNGSVFVTAANAAQEPTSQFAEETYTTLAEAVVGPTALTFLTTAGTNLIIQSLYEGQWASGSSGSHLSQDYYADTLNFLMCPRAERGSSAFRIAVQDPANEGLSLSQVNTTSFLDAIDPKRAVGSATREILRSIGFVLRTDSTSNATPTAVDSAQATATLAATGAAAA